MAKSTVNEPFLTDVKTLRERARQSIAKGAVTQNYGGDVKQTIDILQAVLATEIVCVLRYTMHAFPRPESPATASKLSSPTTPRKSRNT